jgi:hypothetical protein
LFTRPRVNADHFIEDTQMTDETPITRACKAWRDVLPVHPACEIIPPYNDAKLIELGRNIKTSGGIKIPVIVLVQPDGIALLDGRSRLDALCHVGINFEIKVIDGHIVIDAPGYDIPAPIEIVPDANFNAYAFVLSTNLHRRHLKNEEKRAIIRKVIEAQPTLSDRAIAKMAGVDHKTVKSLCLEIKANGEIPISTRVEATGRKARGRRPGQVKETSVKETSVADQKIHADDSTYTEPAPKSVDITPDKPPIAPIEISAKSKPAAAPSTFNTAEILAAVQKALSILDRPVSAPNYEAARKEIKHVIDLLTHKTPKPTAALARAA